MNECSVFGATSRILAINALETRWPRPLAGRREGFLVHPVDRTRQGLALFAQGEEMGLLGSGRGPKPPAGIEVENDLVHMHPGFLAKPALDFTPSDVRGKEGPGPVEAPAVGIPPAKETLDLHGVAAPSLRNPTVAYWAQC
jgi:hypothetical protein